MNIKYVAYNWLGQKVEGILETDSERTAYDQLREGALIPVRVAAVRSRRTLVQVMPSLFRPSAQNIIEMSQQLAALLRSGIPLRQSLIVLRDQNRSVGLKEALRQIVEDIEAGQRFTDACAKHPSVFPAFYVRLLRVAEATGGLPLTLEGLSMSLKRRNAVRDRVRKALTYPAISLAVAAVASFILVTYSLPALIGLLKEFGGTLPLATRLLIAGSEFLKAYSTYLVAGSIGFTALGWALMQTTRGANLRDRVLLRAPVAGKVLVNSNLFTLCSTFGTLIKAGVPPIEALLLAQEGLNNSVIRRGLAGVTQEASEGGGLGQAFRRRREFPPLLSQGIVTGEVAGNLPEILGGLADYYEQETERSVGAATELIQPAVILIVAGLVGFVAVAVISGIYSTIGAVK